MKVYKGYNGCKEVPEIKIKNKILSKIGFKAGAEFSIVYGHKKIILLIDDNKSEGGNDQKN